MDFSDGVYTHGRITSDTLPKVTPPSAKMDLLGEASDGEQEIPDIIISRSSIPEAERVPNIRMAPQLSDQDEETETDSTKESGAEDFEDTTSDQKEMQATSSNVKLEASTLQLSVEAISLPSSREIDAVKESQQDALTLLVTAGDKAAAPTGLFPVPNIEEFFSDDNMSEDDCEATEDHAQQFKADTAAFEYLEGIDQPDNHFGK